MRRPSDITLDQVASECQEFATPSVESHCLTSHGVEGGFVYQAPNHYWTIQWREALIYFGGTIVLLSFSVWTVRRWST
jgi:hypothetical protein